MCFTPISFPAVAPEQRVSRQTGTNISGSNAENVNDETSIIEVIVLDDSSQQENQTPANQCQQTNPQPQAQAEQEVQHEDSQVQLETLSQPQLQLRQTQTLEQPSTSGMQMRSGTDQGYTKVNYAVT